MGMQGNTFFMNAKVIEQGRAMARILAGDPINCIQNMQCTQGYIA
jgi:hypothetical protein